MVINYTAWLGLSKPEDDELARNWVNNLDHVEANNNLLMYEMNINFKTYTPQLIATTTAPSVGAGSRKGTYCDRGGIVFGNFIIEFLDPGITPGNGEYGISLPHPVDESFHVVGISLAVNSGQYSIIGEGYIYDTNNINTSGSVALGVVIVADTYYVRLITDIYGAPAKTSRFVRDAMPFTVAHQDKLTGHFIYKRSY